MTYLALSLSFLGMFLVSAVNWMLADQAQEVFENLFQGEPLPNLTRMFLSPFSPSLILFTPLLFWGIYIVCTRASHQAHVLLFCAVANAVSIFVALLFSIAVLLPFLSLVI